MSFIQNQITIGDTYYLEVSLLIEAITYIDSVQNSNQLIPNAGSAISSHLLLFQSAIIGHLSP